MQRTTAVHTNYPCDLRNSWTDASYFSVHHVLILALTLLKHPQTSTPSILDMAHICSTFCKKYVSQVETSTGYLRGQNIRIFLNNTHTHISLLRWGCTSLELRASTLTWTTLIRAQLSSVNLHLLVRVLWVSEMRLASLIMRLTSMLNNLFYILRLLAVHISFNVSYNYRWCVEKCIMTAEEILLFGTIHQLLRTTSPLTQSLIVWMTW